MIIKGKSIFSFLAHGRHLLKIKQAERKETAGWNDEVEVICTQNLFAGEDLLAGMREMAAVAAGSKKCRDWLYTASINPNGRDLTDSEAEEAAHVLLKELGFSDQHQWLMVQHRKDGRSHFHLAINRVDPVTLRAVNLGWNYLKHELVARKLEQRFQLTPVRGAFTSRQKRADGRLADERPAQSFSTAEAQQAERTAIPLQRVSADLRRAWENTKSGDELVHSLDQHGYVLAKGDRRDIVLVDWKGGVHSLQRRLKSVTGREIRERLEGVQLANLRRVAEERAELLRLSKPLFVAARPNHSLSATEVINHDLPPLPAQEGKRP